MSLLQGSRLRRFLPWCLLLLWFLGIFVISSIPAREIPGPNIPHLDKLVHFVAYGFGGFFLAWGFASIGRRRNILLVGVLITILGALDEWYQTLTPGRSGLDVGDMIADALGGFFGAFLYHKLHERISRLVDFFIAKIPA